MNLFTSSFSRKINVQQTTKYNDWFIFLARSVVKQKLNNFTKSLVLIVFLF